MTIMRLCTVALLTGSAVALSGCLPMLAASVVDASVGAAVGKPKINEGAAPVATQTCSARAAHYGAVHIIDTVQNTPSKIIVYGAVDDGKARSSFKCAYGTKITAFSMHALPAQH